MNKFSFHCFYKKKCNKNHIAPLLYSAAPLWRHTFSHLCRACSIDKVRLDWILFFCSLQMSYSTGRTVSLWQSTTRGAFSGCGCTTPVDCFPLGKLSTRFRGSWRIPPPHSQERKNWGLWLLETGRGEGGGVFRLVYLHWHLVSRTFSLRAAGR